MNKSRAVIMVALLALLAGRVCFASPVLSLESSGDFQAAIDAGNIVSTTTPGADLLDHYPGNDFAVSELYVYTPPGGGDIDDLDGGLVMAWGDSEDVEYYAQWQYVYDEDPDLVGETITAVCFPPVGINSISLAIFDAPAGLVRSWDWNVGPGGPLFHNVNNTITINVAPQNLGGPAEATPVSSSFFDNGMDPALTARIGADENGNWVRFADLNPVTGQPQPWNYWVTVSVTPEPATLSLLALGGLALIRRRRAERESRKN